MRDALALVKRELGPDAVILGTRTLPGTRLRRPRVEITAAPPGLNTPAPRLRSPAATSSSAAAAPPAVAAAPATEPPPAVPKPWYPCYVELVQREVAEDVARQIVRQAAARHGESSADPARVRAALREFLATLLPGDGGLQLPTGNPRRVAFVGPSGGGKTTTVAKLAADFKLRQNRQVAVLSLDMQRPAAHEQLRRYAEVIGVPFQAAQTVTDVRSALKAVGPFELLLIDTPGVGRREQGRFARLASLLRAARPDEVHLVLPAILLPGVQAQVAQGFAPLGLTSVVLTRLDDAIGYGVILNVLRQLNLAVSYITTGQNIPRDIEPACGKRLSELLLT